MAFLLCKAWLGLILPWPWLCCSRAQCRWGSSYQKCQTFKWCHFIFNTTMDDMELEVLLFVFCIIQDQLEQIKTTSPKISPPTPQPGLNRTHGLWALEVRLQVVHNNTWKYTEPRFEAKPGRVGPGNTMQKCHKRVHPGPCRNRSFSAGLLQNSCWRFCFTKQK